MFLLLAFRSSSVSAQTNPNALPPLAPAYPEIQPTFWEAHRAAVILGAIVLTLLVGFATWLMLRPKRKAVLPPEQIAQETLTKLLSQPEDGQVLSAVSQILRRYVSQKLNLPDGERTTAEFIQNLTQLNTADVKLSETISSFLRECDVRKFSLANALPPLDAAKRALELVEQAEKTFARSAPVSGAALPNPSAISNASKSPDIAPSENNRTS